MSNLFLLKKQHFILQHYIEIQGSDYINCFDGLFCSFSFVVIPSITALKQSFENRIWASA